MVAVNAPEVYVAVVAPEISIQEVPFSDDCHLVIVPVDPLKVKTPLVFPAQIVVPPETEPPTLAASTATIAEEEAAVEHTPLFTTTW